MHQQTSEQGTCCDAPIQVRYMNKDFIRKIMLSAFGLMVLWNLVSTSCSYNRCEDLCHDLGYAGFRYTPASSGRAGPSTPEACHCLRQEEMEMNNVVPKGVKIDM